MPGPLAPETVHKLFSAVLSAFSRKPFVPHRIFSGPHAQTLGAYAWPRRARLKPTVANDQERLFQVDEGVQVLAQCRWQSSKNDSPTMVIWHGMEGSTSSVYMWSTAEKAFRAGFNVVRVNYRNCGGTEHLSPTLYHGGMSTDLKNVIEELISKDQIQRLYVIGFSLGGNLVLKALGEYGEQFPKQLVAASVISPSVDLKASTDLILKSSNWIYHKNFVLSLKKRVQLKSKRYPDRYDLTRLGEVRTIRDFDEQFTSRSNGFENADDYYFKSSSVRVVDQIRVPTLIIHAEDDPFIPFAPLNEKAFVDNPYLLMIKTERGGHVAFIGADNKNEDRFWAENRVVEFCRLCDSRITSGSA
jgi:predicted alpha/beta-fold hydrolase